MKQPFSALVWLALVVSPGFFCRAQEIAAQPPEFMSPITLDGVIVAPEKRHSVALVRKVGSRRGRSLKPGEAIVGYRLVEVTEEGAVFETDERTLELFLERPFVVVPKPPLPAAPVKAKANSRREGSSEESAITNQRDEDGGPKLDNTSRPPAGPEATQRRLVGEVPVLLKETELTPRLEDGKIRGIWIERLPDQTLLSLAGLVAGDVLLSLNDTHVDSLSTLVALYAELGSEGEIRMELLRCGERMKLIYDLTEAPAR